MPHKTTIRDIANATGLGVSTVCYVLSGKNLNHISEKNQKLICETARKMNYTPNLMARGLRCGRSGLIAFFTDYDEDTFLPDLINGIEKIISKEQKTLLLCHIRSEKELQDKINLVLSLSVEGIFNRCDMLEIMEKDKNILSTTLPCVRVACPPNEKYPSSMVSLDFMVKMICEYLIGKGHHQLAVTGIPQSRMDAIRDFMTSIHEPAPFFINSNTPEEILSSMMDNPQNTALITDDRLACDTILLAQSKGIAIPQAFSILGNDGLPCGKYISPKLTTVAQPKVEQGEAAAEILLKWINSGTKPDSIVLNSFLVERETVRDISTL